MTFTPLLYIATAVITHYVASFIQASLHRLVAHRKIGGALRKNHLRYHHAIYSRDVMVSEKYIDEEKSLTTYGGRPLLGQVSQNVIQPQTVTKGSVRGR